AQKAFRILCAGLRIVLGEFDVERSIKPHSLKRRSRFLGSQGGYRETAQALGISKSWLIEFIPVFRNMIEQRFYAMRGFLGVVAAIDGTLIPITRSRYIEGFYCRKFYPALNMQAIVDASMMFRSVDVRPGSWSDQEIWNASEAGKTLRYQMPPRTHVIADAGYALRPWMLIPKRMMVHLGRRKLVDIVFLRIRAQAWWLRDIWHVEGTFSYIEGGYAN
ncbi:TPA: hypothetical protein N0F65_001018, partial [Lagenidium giganteum]